MQGTEENYCQAVWGRELSTAETVQACDAYAEANGLQGKVRFVLSPETLVTTCVGSKVNLVPREGYYREIRLASLLDHEVGTHFLRSHNHKQCFASKLDPKKSRWSHKSGWLLATEEGLATLNTNRMYADARLWVPALHYHAVLLASRLPWSGLWRELSTFLGTSDHERLWTTCLRVKRGLDDTSKPGCYAKDQSNFCGALKLLRRRRSIDFALLHCVRVSIEDFGKALPDARRALATGKALLPAFVVGDEALEEYHKALDRMAAANGVDALDDAAAAAAPSTATSKPAEPKVAAARLPLDSNAAANVD